jgi:hypothetical protein
VGRTYKDMKSEPKWERINKRVIDDTPDDEDRSPKPSRKTRDSKDKPKGRRR